MNSVELSYGATISIPSREYALLIKMLKSGRKEFKKTSFTPRAERLADNLVSYQVLDRDEDTYYIRPIIVTDKAK